MDFGDIFAPICAAFLFAAVVFSWWAPEVVTLAAFLVPLGLYALFLIIP